MPDEGVAYIMTEFGLDISKATFTSYKAAEKARARKKAGRPRGRRPGAVAAGAAAARNGTADVVEAVQSVKRLVDQLGAAKVQRLADISE